MIAIRLAVSAAAALTALAALGVSHLQPSAQRLAVTAVIGLIVPLFWPGCGATAARTVLRVAAWSAAAACMAGLVLKLAGGPTQPLSLIATACGMLLLVMLAAHAAAAILEGRLQRAPRDAEGARETAGRAAAVALALLGTLPLWLGPAAQLLADAHPWAIDATLGVSPLTHLAVASGNDLLRNQWFYEHSNLAALQFAYPSLAGTALSYGAVGLVLTLLPLSFPERDPPIAGARPVLPTKE